MRWLPFLLLMLPLLSFSVDGAILEVDDDISMTDTDIDDNLYAMSSTFFLDSMVDGDVMSISGTTNIMRPVYGDVTFISGDSSINGPVNGNLVAIAADTIISSDVSGDVVVLGGNVRIDNNVDIGGDILIYANKAELVNRHGGDVKIAGKRIILHSTIEGNADLRSSNIEMWNGAKILGDLNYTARERNEDLEARTHGDVHFNEDTTRTIAALFGSLGLGASMVSLNISWLLLLLGLGLLVLHVCPNFARLVGENLRKKRWISLVYGVVFIFVVPLLSFLFLVTIIGVPVAALLMISLGLGFVFGKIYTIFVVGGYLRERLFVQKTGKKKSKKGSPAQRRDMKYTLDYGVGLAAYAILSFIPVLSFFVSLFAAVFGIGAMWLTKLDIFNFLKENKKL
ncbi:MAG: hypothetical protein ACLFTR_02675 [Candidatus Woesearchaeota archaeon]